MSRLRTTTEHIQFIADFRGAVFEAGRVAGGTVELNPEPKLLDPLVKNEKTVPIEVRVVSGDNVEIEKMEGRAYRPAKP